MNQQLKTKNLFAAMLFSIALFSAQTVFAQETDAEWYKDWDKYPGGAANVCSDNDIDNDEDGLIEICTLEMLDAVRYVLNGSGYKASASATTSTTGCKTGGCIGYELVRDLDFKDDDSYSNASANKSKWTSGNGWPPIGGEFNAIFEGNGHALSHLMISARTQYAGLFAQISGNGVINGIGLVNVDVTNAGLNTGSLVGENSADIRNSYSTGQVSSGRNTGGLVGTNVEGGNISNSYSTVRITAGSFNGGLVGFNAVPIHNSYGAGQITAGTRGGLVGYNQGSDARISNSYSIGEGNDLIGFELFNPPEPSNSYWDGTIGLASSTYGGTSQSTVALQSTTSTTGIYQNWSEDNWDFGTDKQYPAVKYAEFTVSGHKTCGTSQQPACGSLLPRQKDRAFTGRDWKDLPGGAANVCSDDDIDKDDDSLIEVCYLEDLDAMRHVLNGEGYKSTSGAVTKYDGCPLNNATPPQPRCRGYELTRDLDFEDDDSYRDASANKSKWTSGDGWPPIGGEFNAIFEGNGHTLSHLMISTGTRYVGLFARLKSGKVINAIGLVDINVMAQRQTHKGGLVGVNNGTISNSYSTGVTRDATNIGGLVGTNEPNGTIKNSYSGGEISLASYGGGLVGTSRGKIRNSYSIAQVVRSSFSGGLVGRHVDGGISNSYSAGKDIGLIGSKNFGPPAPSNSYWDAASGVASTQGGTSQSTVALQSPTVSTGIYSAWSEDDWDFGTDIQYPAIKYNTDDSGYKTCYEGQLGSQQPECGSLLAGQRTKSFAIPTTATSVTVQAVEGETVTLNTMRTGNVEWKQTEGPSVFYLSTTDSAVLEFEVPFNVVVRGAKTETLVFHLIGDSATTVSIVVFDDNDDGSIDKPTLTRLSARTLAVSADLATDPDGTGMIEAYQWQICRPSPDCRQEAQWETVSGVSTDSAYQIPDAEAIEDNQFRVQLTYRDGQNFQTTRNSTTLTYVPLSIADIAPIATTEGEVVTIVAEASVIFDGLSYVWHTTTGDKTPSILKDSIVTSATLVFTIPNEWADTAQTTLVLSVAVSDGATTSTKPVIVNITRVDNGGLMPIPKIDERDQVLSISPDLTTDPDGAGTIQTYQWQICRSTTCNQEAQWQNTSGASTSRSYHIPAADAKESYQFRVQLTYRDGQNYQTTVTSAPLVYAALRIIDLDPIATTEGEIVSIAARVNVSAGGLSYVWRVTAGDKKPSILEDSTVTSATLVFTVPDDWANTPQTTLNLFVSVGDGTTTGTNRVIVNITRTDNGGLATPPTITEAERELTVSADLTTDPDGDGTIEAYQWQLCRGSSATVVCDNEDSWMPAPGTSSTASSYTIQESDAVVGNQFRVQLTYRDGQGYSRTVISETLSYGQVKAIFIRLKLFLEGALQ